MAMALDLVIPDRASKARATSRRLPIQWSVVFAISEIRGSRFIGRG